LFYNSHSEMSPKPVDMTTKYATPFNVNHLNAAINLSYTRAILSSHLTVCGGPRQLIRYGDTLRAGRSGDRTPFGSEISRTRPDLPWGPPSLLYNGYRVSFPGVKRPGPGVDHPPPSSAEVEERVELYLYSPLGRYGVFLG
jgi:hypothetical protein